MSPKICRINSSNNKLDKRTTMGRAASGKTRQLKSHWEDMFKNSAGKNYPDFTKF